MAPPPVITPGHDPRRHPRVPVSGRATVAWTDSSGLNRAVTGRYTNASRSGVALELRDPLPDRAYVSFKCDGIKLSGSGAVRYCSRRNMGWRVGVEFSGGLSWQPAA